MWWGCIDFGKITASFSYVVRSYLSCTKTTSLFYCFSGIVEAVASNSLLDDLPSVSDLDAIKTEGEQTLPTDAALSKFSQVDIKEVITQLVRNRASLKVIWMVCTTITSSTLRSWVVFEKYPLSLFLLIVNLLLIATWRPIKCSTDYIYRLSTEVSSDWCISNLAHGWWILILSIVSVRICSCSGPLWCIHGSVICLLLLFVVCRWSLLP